MSAQRLQGKVCIVTGSSSGLGRAISIAYAREGAVLVCADLQPTGRTEIEFEAENSTVELIQATGADAIFMKTDVSKAVEMKNLMEATVARYGRIDV